jgi:hypothetical protein
VQIIEDGLNFEHIACLEKLGLKQIKNATSHAEKYFFAFEEKCIPQPQHHI